MRGAWRKIEVQCPYCSRGFTVLATDITGELRAVRCLGCNQPYVVEVAVQVLTRVREVGDAIRTVPPHSPRTPGSNPDPPPGPKPSPPPNPPPPPSRARRRTPFNAFPHSHDDGEREAATRERSRERGARVRSVEGAQY